MGTKANPGAYDCYGSAEPDEELFTLKGKDEFAPFLVTMWSLLHQGRHGANPKAEEASACANRMAEQAEARGVKPITTEEAADLLAQGTLAGLFPETHRRVHELSQTGPATKGGAE